MGRHLLEFRITLAALALLGGTLGCHSSDDDGGTATAAPVQNAAGGGSCAALTGTPWVPSVAGAADANHSGAASIAQQVVTASGPLVGLAEPAPASKEISVSFTVPDLGPYGSFTLVAEASNLSGGATGAYPILVSLKDGVNTEDYVNVARDTGACGTVGYFSCPGGANCAANPSCTVAYPSAFNDRTHWQQHQIATFGYTSVNTFPTCNREDDPSPVADSVARPRCAFNSDFFTGSPKRLRAGTYTARYVLLAEYVSLAGFGYAGDLKVTVVKKTDTDTSVGGAVDLNVILVGAKNVQASRTAAGKRNLDTLFSYVQTYYGQASVGVKLGKINAIEWDCAAGGDAYANVDVNSLGTLFAQSSALVPAASNNRALNIFLVSTIPDDASDGLTVLGLAGGIGGNPLVGSMGSGLAFSSLNKLDSYNASCTSDPCPLTAQDPDFADMGSTIAHEMGHFLGLNHPSESGGTSHDVVYDTPLCTITQTVNGTPYITITSCLSSSNAAFQPTGQKCSTACTAAAGAAYSNGLARYCPAVQECQFNHVMWWTSKNFNQTAGTGDGNLFSVDSGKIINYSPFIQ